MSSILALIFPSNSYIPGRPDIKWCMCVCRCVGVTPTRTYKLRLSLTNAFSHLGEHVYVRSGMEWAWVFQFWLPFSFIFIHTKCVNFSDCLAARFDFPYIGYGNFHENPYRITGSSTGVNNIYIYRVYTHLQTLIHNIFRYNILRMYAYLYVYYICIYPAMQQ